MNKAFNEWVEASHEASESDSKTHWDPFAKNTTRRFGNTKRNWDHHKEKQ